MYVFMSSRRFGWIHGKGFEKSKIVNHPKKLKCNEFVDFWVSWDYDTGKLAIGEGHDPSKNAFVHMVYSGDAKLDVQYVSFSSGADIRADWKIYEQCQCKSSAYTLMFMLFTA